MAVRTPDGERTSLPVWTQLVITPDPVSTLIGEMLRGPGAGVGAIVGIGVGAVVGTIVGAIVGTTVGSGSGAVVGAGAVGSGGAVGDSDATVGTVS